MWHWGSRDTGLYLEINTPGQRVALPIPQAELPVMATSEEAVLEGMCAQSPELVSVALQQSICCHLCPAPTALPASSLSPWPSNLDHRGESLDQISPQQCILRGSHQQLRAQPLSNGPHSPKVFRNLEWWQKVRGPLALRRPPPSLPQPSPALTSVSWRATNPGPHCTSRRSRPPPLSTVPSRRRHRAKMEPS